MTNPNHPAETTPQELEHPDGSRTLVWTRRGRMRIAVVGSAIAIAAGAAGALPPSSGGDDNPQGGGGDQSAQVD